MNKYIESDLYRLKGDTSFKTAVKAYHTSSAFRWQVAYRLVRSSGISKLIGRFLWRINRSKNYIQISPECEIGYGLYIGHGGPVFVNPTAHIGNNCNLSQFDTIGANDGKAATIGDNVYIGPNVCIVEDVTIGDNVTIGAGSVVTKDIPENATAVGNYAKVINYNNPGRYIKKKYEV